MLGDFSWTPPLWIKRSVARIRAHRLVSSATVILILALLNGGVWTWRWYQKQPKPHRVAVTVEAIPVTPLAKELVPAPMRINFDDSAARLDQIGKGLTSGIRIEPSVEGDWKWTSDRQLVLRPRYDWPAEQKYRISFDKSLFPPHVRLDRYSVDAETPQFTAKINETEFYQDPRDPAIKQVVATMEFTHKVNRGELENRIALSLLGGSQVFKESDVKRPFTVDYGLHDRLAYIRSAPLQLPQREDFMKLVVAKGIATTQGGARTRDELESKVRVPDLYSFFRIDNSLGQIVRNEDNQPEQVLIINTTATAKSEDIQKALHVYLLPNKPREKQAEAPEEVADDRHDGDEDESEDDESDDSAASTSDEECEVSSAAEVDDEILKRSKPVALRLIPSEHEQSKIHSFKFVVEADGFLFVRIDKGVQAVGGFPLGETYANLVAVPALPREIQIQGNGGILALNGERKLSIKSRGVAHIQFDIARISAGQINHLVTQTDGNFENPDFINNNFDEENIARIALEQQAINLQNKFKANYSAFDFSNHLRVPSDGGGERGLFLLSAREWDPEKKKASRNIVDRRFVLVTDIGMLVKKSADGASDVFVASIKSGEPLAGVEVQILAKNGETIAHNVSGKEGRVTLPSLGKLQHERKPVAFTARLKEDIAFMPFDRADRQLDFSRFDIDGVENISPEQLDAFLFTERGIYRPGDEVHIGCVVKQRNWRGQLEGLPLEAEILDARGLSAQVRKLTLPALGFAELNFQTAYQSPTGEYQIHLYLVRDGKRGTLLGQASFHVKEFLPDRMKIETRLSQGTDAGWIDPKEVQAFVRLQNLYGTPASERRIVSRMRLAPHAFHFAQFPNYVFHDPLREGRKAPEPQNVELGEKTTDADGKTTVDLDLERFADATYEMTLTTEGFEAEGGRSVSAYNTLLVSALPRVIGYKVDGALNYIPKDSPHAIDFIAIDPSLKKIAADKLHFNLIEQTYVSILLKKDNGNYVFESVSKERLVRQDEINIGPDGFRYALNTATPGSFVLEVRDEEDRRVSKLCFSVVGRGNVSRSLEKNAELAVKLDRAQYNAGDEIELSIVAPFTGSGLITIESDRVQAHQWFKSRTTSSLQRIRVPDGFDGTGYVNVSFIRALDSKEIFMSPLSYAVAPFTVNKEKRRLQVDIRAEKMAKPGEPLKISYHTDRPSKIMIFAVDRGILQVTDFTTPDPLGYFFRKTALAVQTSQIVDLIIPEFSILRSTAAFGGDADKRLNPFRRVTEKPVVFWSGIIDADKTEREITYDVPDYFDGTLAIMAVAIANDAVGCADQDSIIRGPFIITPTVPTVAAPNDRFEVGVTIANNVTGSGENAEIALKVEPSTQLEIVQSPALPLHIAEGREATVTFTVRAKDELGAASLAFHAAANGQEATRRATLSVRPAVPFMTQVRSGNFTKGSVDLPIERNMHSEFRELDATISAVPLGLAHGLEFYLRKFPHGCTEQISSAAFARLVLADESDFGLTRAEVETQLEKVYTTLRRRQTDQGAFGYWSSADASNDFISVYATHLLSEAKAAGFAPPPDLLKSALRHLQTMAAREPRDLADARTIAYAIYVLSREGFITTNYILNLTDYLDHNFGKKWPNDLSRVYVAASWSILKKEKTARELIASYKMGTHDHDSLGDFYQPLGADSQYLAIIARHFPDLLKHVSPEDFQTVVRPISTGEFNTLSAAYAVWALKSYSQYVAKNPPELSVVSVGKDKRETQLSLSGQLVRHATFPAEIAALRFGAKNSTSALGTFYQIIEAGFDRTPPTTSVIRGLEIYRELAQTAQLGQPITVRIKCRALDQRTIPNVAIIDLLPGGFEIVNSSANQNGCDYVETREDRSIFYGTIGSSTRTISYQIKATNRGEFVVPPPYAESMYDRAIQGRGVAGKITVIE